jgi:hypothetical protein
MAARPRAPAPARGAAVRMANPEDAALEADPEALLEALIMSVRCCFSQE